MQRSMPQPPRGTEDARGVSGSFPIYASLRLVAAALDA